MNLINSWYEIASSALSTELLFCDLYRAQKWMLEVAHLTLLKKIIASLSFPTHMHVQPGPAIQVLVQPPPWHACIRHVSKPLVHNLLTLLIMGQSP